MGSISCKDSNLLLWLQFSHFILCYFPSWLMHLFIVCQNFLLKKPPAINLHKWSLFLIHSGAGADGNAAQAWVLGFWVLSSLCHPHVTRRMPQQDKPSWSAPQGRVGSQKIWRAEHRAVGARWLQEGFAAGKWPKQHQSFILAGVLPCRVLWAKPINCFPRCCGDLQQARFK